MLAAPLKEITEEEYLDIERESQIKHEYHEGEIFSMAGASETHNLIVTNIVRELGNQLRKKDCYIYANDMKLQIKDTSKFVYPDVIVVCGERKFFDDSRDVLLEANLIIEVLSDSTEAYDRGKKFSSYRQIKSFKEYLLISQHEKQIEKFLKHDNGYWKFSEIIDSQEDIILESIDCKLNIDDVYEKVL
ncbi:MAG: Uma2 family endonuclease [Desulfobacterales bacterium]|nr:Uma2 family endonuclease [Desulfobacterales bacterium]